MKAKIEWYRNQGIGEDNERKKQQKELEDKILQSENEYKKNVIEYKATIEKINQIKLNIEEIFAQVDNETAKKYEVLKQSQGLTQDNVMTYLGMIENMINDMIKQYAFLLAQKLKQAKNLEDDDPVIVTLNNILMVAPKVESSKQDLAQREDVFPRDDDDTSQFDEDDRPLKQEEFKKLYMVKQNMESSKK